MAVVPNAELPDTWNLWLHRETIGGEDYASSLEKKTIVRKWSDFSYLEGPINGKRIHFMKEGILPLWEDPAVVAGGYLVIRIEKQHADTVWKALLFALASHSLDPHLCPVDELCGLTLSCRHGKAVFQLWTRCSTCHSYSPDCSRTLLPPLRILFSTLTFKCFYKQCRSKRRRRHLRSAVQEENSLSKAAPTTNIEPKTPSSDGVDSALLDEDVFDITSVGLSEFLERLASLFHRNIAEKDFTHKSLKRLVRSALVQVPDRVGFILECRQLVLASRKEAAQPPTPASTPTPTTTSVDPVSAAAPGDCLAGPVDSNTQPDAPTATPKVSSDRRRRQTQSRRKADTDYGALGAAGEGGDTWRGDGELEDSDAEAWDVSSSDLEDTVAVVSSGEAAPEPSPASSARGAFPPPHAGAPTPKLSADGLLVPLPDEVSGPAPGEAEASLQGEASLQAEASSEASGLGVAPAAQRRCWAVQPFLIRTAEASSKGWPGKRFEKGKGSAKGLPSSLLPLFLEALAEESFPETEEAVRRLVFELGDSTSVQTCLAFMVEHSVPSIPVTSLFDVIVKQRHWAAAKRLLIGWPEEVRKEFVAQLIRQQHDVSLEWSIILDLAEALQVKPLFPELFRIEEKSALRSHIWNGAFNTALAFVEGDVELQQEYVSAVIGGMGKQHVDGRNFEFAAALARHFGLVDQCFPQLYVEAILPLTAFLANETKPSGGPYLQLSLSRDHVHMISTPSELEGVASLLRIGPSSSIEQDVVINIGFDCEWRFAKRCALLQLALPTDIFLVDLFSLRDTAAPFVCALFAAQHLSKLGFSLGNDIKVLSASFAGFEQLADPRKLSNVVDLQKLYSMLYAQDGKSPSLSQVCRRLLGLPIDKSLRIFNWERRPLPENRQLYAALDAFCLLQVYEALNAQSQRQFGAPAHALATKKKNVHAHPRILVSPLTAGVRENV